MSASGALSVIRTIIESVSATPPWRHVKRGRLDDDPGGTAIKHRFAIEKASTEKSGPLMGPGSSALLETHTIDIVTAYPRGGDNLAVLREIEDDHKAITDALIDRSVWGGGGDIAAVLLRSAKSLLELEDRTKVRMTYEVIIHA